MKSSTKKKILEKLPFVLRVINGALVIIFLIYLYFWLKKYG